MISLQTIRQHWHAPDGYGAILKVGLPLIASMFSTSIMMFIDRIFLSLYSVDAIAAVIPSALATITLLFFFTGTVGYSTVIIAQYIGSGAPSRVGPALWQGLWLALLGGGIMALLSLGAEPLFAYAGHEPAVQELEVIYFQTLCLGSFIALSNNVLGCFYAGRGQTRPVLVANLFATAIKIPCDYILIFGIPGIIPSLGIFGAAIATLLATSTSVAILAPQVFSRANEQQYATRSGWHLRLDMLWRLIKFGVPSGFNMLMDNLSFFWFTMEVGALGKVALAASNIAVSLNGLVFTPMTGMNLAVASLTGQAMGAGNATGVVRLTRRSMIISLCYMIPCSMVLAGFAGPLVSLYAPGDMTPEQFAPVRDIGVTLMYFVALYSLVDSGSIIYFGGLKGAGDTKGILYILVIGIFIFLCLPITVVKHLGLGSVEVYWTILTVYIFFLAAGAIVRFRTGKWRNIRVVETAKPLSSL